MVVSESESHSVMSDSLQPQGLYSPWNSPGQNPGVGSLSLSRGSPNPGIEPRSPVLHSYSLPAEPQGKSKNAGWVAYPFSRGSSQTRNWTGVYCIAGRFFTNWATRQAHECESWTIKKAEHWRIDAFELWCQWILLTVSWTARRSSQSILKEISLECSLEGLLMRRKFQYFGHLIRRTYSLEKTLMLGGIEGGRRRGWQRMRWLGGITDSMEMSLSKCR